MFTLCWLVYFTALVAVAYHFTSLEAFVGVVAYVKHTVSASPTTLKINLLHTKTQL